MVDGLKGDIVPYEVKTIITEVFYLFYFDGIDSTNRKCVGSCKIFFKLSPLGWIILCMWDISMRKDRDIQWVEDRDSEHSRPCFPEY